MSDAESRPAAPKRELTLFDSTCIIVGIIIGAGIYRSTPAIAGFVGGPLLLIGFWFLGGLISLIGAACYAELASTYPREGGEYVFLTKAYGRRAGFLFAWSEFWIIRPGNVGAMAYIFATYFAEIVPWSLGRYSFMVYACSAIILLTAVNVMGVRSGKWTQNVLTSIKVLGLLAIFAVGLFLVTPSPVAETSAPATSSSNFSLALIFVLFTFGGWNEIAYVAAEVRSPQKNILRALVVGLLAVTLIYVLVTWAMLSGLGFAGVSGSESMAADLVALRFGDVGRAAISLLICLSCLGSINGMLFTGSRVYYALGTEHRLYRWLGRWSARFNSPVRSLTIQAAIGLGLVIFFGLDSQQFELLVIFTTPFFFGFLSLVAVALIVLRYKDPHAQRTYRATLYPLTPLLLCASSLFMLYASLSHAYANSRPEALWSIGIFVAGVLLSFYDPPQERDASKPDNAK